VYDHILEIQTTSTVAPTPPEHLKKIIRTYILEDLLLGAEQEIGDDESLVDSGILDSTGAVELVAFLENTFGFKVDDHEIGPDNLETISRICNLITRKTSAAPAA
jgi:acyl carrier protein